MNSPAEQIALLRKQMGGSLLIMAHHYQRSSVIRHADETGDSLELAKKTALHPETERIVFCGVRFMAESADILSSERQTVYMPDTSAGCPMAGMATEKAMMRAWERLTDVSDDWIPVVYVNSTAGIKACCGRLGGSSCTSSNAARVMQWAFDKGKKVLFIPDEHLGRNTARDLGIPDSEVAVYDPTANHGGLDSQTVSESRIVVWKGYCLVHTAFTADAVRQVRSLDPDAKIILHPEAPRDAVDIADAHGSTSQIIRYVEEAEDGSTIVIGTEINLVERLAEMHRDRIRIKALIPSVCANMSKTNEESLLDILKKWPEQNEVHVPATESEDARRALEVMLDLK